MKKTKFSISKILSVLLLIVLSVSLLGFSPIPEENDDSEKLREFTLTSDFSVLSDGAESYECIRAPYGLCEDFRKVFVYKNKAKLENSSKSYTVSSSGEGVNVYRVYDDGNCYIYTDKAEGEKLEKFFGGEYSTIRIKNSQGVYESIAGESLSTMISGAKPGQLYQVSDLERLERYPVYAYDSTDSVYFHIGNIYIFNRGAVRYLDYSWLENSNFTADGELSYRSGEVPLVDVTEEALSDFLYAKENLKYPVREVVYEGADNDFDMNEVEIVGETAIKVMFWIAVAIMGFIIPAVAIALGLLIPRTKKMRGKKYWYSLSIAGAAWCVFAAIFALIILIA